MVYLKYEMIEIFGGKVSIFHVISFEIWNNNDFQISDRDLSMP